MVHVVAVAPGPVTARERAGDAVTAPGVPPSYGDPAGLVSGDRTRQ